MVTKRTIVAPYTGAWIEIITRWFCEKLGVVAPYTGAWIEIFRKRGQTVRN